MYYFKFGMKIPPGAGNVDPTRAPIPLVLPPGWSA